MHTSSHADESDGMKRCEELPLSKNIKMINFIGENNTLRLLGCAARINLIVFYIKLLRPNDTVLYRNTAVFHFLDMD